MSQSDPQHERFDTTLRRAMEIPVPDGLEARILARQDQSHGSGWWQRPWPSLGDHWAAATVMTLSLVLLVGLGVYTSGVYSPGKDIKGQVLAYVEEDWSRLSQPGAVPTEELEGMFHQIGARLESRMKDVSYCEMTTVGEHPCATMVIRGRAGPVVALFIEDAYVPARVPIRTAHFSGIILPAPKGCIAVVGQTGEDLQFVENQVMASITWL